MTWKIAGLTAGRTSVQQAFFEQSFWAHSIVQYLVEDKGEGRWSS